MGRTATVEQGITMKSLASRIAKKFNTQENKVARVLQTWVNSGIIIPMGPVHQGAGIYRAFQESELLKAAVLYEFHRNAYPIHQLKAAREFIDFLLKSKHSILEQAVLGKTWYLHLSLSKPWLLGKNISETFGMKEIELGKAAMFSKKPYAPGLGECWSLLSIRLDSILHKL